MCHSSPVQALIFRDSRCLGSLVSPCLASYTDTEGSTLAAEERDQDSSPKLIVQELSIIYDTWTPAWSSSQAKPIYLPVDASFRSSGFRIGELGMAILHSVPFSMPCTPGRNIRLLLHRQHC